MTDDKKNTPDPFRFQNEDLFNALFINKTFILYRADLKEENQRQEELLKKREAALRQLKEEEKRSSKGN